MNGPSRDVLAAFTIDDRPWSSTPLSGGHIHGTWKLTDGHGRSVVGQSVNRTVFADLEACEHNLTVIDARFSTGQAVRVPSFLRTQTGTVHHTDADGTAWRLSEYIEPGNSVASLGSVAALFGRYARALQGVELRETIDRFHHLGWRRLQLDVAIRADRVGRLATCEPLVADVIDLFEHIVDRLVVIGPLPLRPTHGDAKLANVIAYPGVVIDLDTTMPATLIVDLGELLRSGAIVGREDEPDLSVLRVDGSAVTGIVAGFLDGLDGDVTDGELSAFPLAGPRMAIFNAIRMLTDHLNGDVYYRVARRDHNLDRARAQLRSARLLLDVADAVSEFARR